MKILTRIRFATDGSELAIEAAQRAAGMLVALEATVLGVVPPPPLAPSTATADAPSTAMADIESVALPETVAQIGESVTAHFEAGIERTITAIGRPAERRVVHGDPAIEICRSPRRAGSTLSPSDRAGRGSSSGYCWAR